jgi:hypothetical protein
MKKIIKPFSVERRHAGRKAAGVGKPLQNMAEAAPPETAASSAWPEIPEPRPSDARRVADAFFARAIVPEDAMATSAPSANQAPARRVLQTLGEEDHIKRLLEEEEAHRPRRGRKPLQGERLAPLAHISEKRGEAPEPPSPLPQRIAGYIRGRIFARYARRTEAAPGQYWRKRPKPAW